MHNGLLSFGLNTYLEVEGSLTRDDDIGPSAYLLVLQISFALIIEITINSHHSLCNGNDSIMPCDSDSATEIPLFSLYGI